MSHNRNVLAVVQVSAVVAAFAIGVGAQSLVRMVFAIVFVAAVALQLRRNRSLPVLPWMFLATGGGLVITSAVVRVVHGALANTDSPFPSYAEIPGVAGYLCLIASAVVFTTMRSPRRDPEANLDALLVMAATTIVVFSAVLSEYYRDATVPIAERVGNGVYNVLTLVLVGMVARLAVGEGVRNSAWRLLAGAVIAILANEFFFVLYTVGAEWGLGVTRVVSPVAFICATAAVLHPEAGELTIRRPYSEPVLSHGRLVMLAAALLTVPLALLLSLAADRTADLPLLALGSMFLAVFSLLRISFVVRAKEEVAHLSEALSRSGQALLESSSSQETVAAAAEAMRQVAGQTRFEAVVKPRSSDLAHLLSSSTRSVVELPTSEDALVSAALRLDEQHAEHRTTYDIGDAGEYGSLIVQPNEPIPHTHDVAYRTLCVQIAQAFASVEAAETRAERRLTTLVEQSADLILVVDGNSIVNFVSPNIQRILGKLPDEVMGIDILDLVPEEERDDLALHIAETTNRVETTTPYEASIVTASGDRRWFAISGRDRQTDPQLSGVVLYWRDVTAQRRAQKATQASERRFRSLVQHSSDVVLLLSTTGQVSYISDAVKSVLGRSVSEFIGHGVERVIHENDWELVSRHFAAVCEGLKVQERVEFRAYTATGEVRLFEAIMTNMTDVPEVAGVVINATDVTAERSLERDLKDAETIDPLTLQLNRKSFIQEIDTALRRASISGAAVSIAIIDLDDFKTINDALGPVLADQALVETANRIRRSVRLGDVVARLSGDEFGVLMPDGYSPLESVAAIERVLAELQIPFELDRHPLSPKATAGLSTDVGGANTASVLLREADTALGMAKKNAPGKAIMFEDEMGSAVTERLDLRTGFERALQNEEMRLVYQPIIDLATGRIVSLEALARWKHPERGEVSPSIFIPIAEDSNTITPLGEWALRTACRQVNDWSRQGLYDFTVSVNMSGLTLIEDDVISRVRSILRETKVDPSRIIIEITETVLIDDTEFIADRISALRSLGVALAIDDFGTGYSSLSYLQRYEFDYLKIDRAFVRPLAAPENVKDREIVGAIIRLAKGLGATAIAEGIEGESEHLVLRQLDCDRAQGFLFHRPKEVSEIFEILHEDLALDVAA